MFCFVYRFVQLVLLSVQLATKCLFLYRLENPKCLLFSVQIPTCINIICDRLKIYIFVDRVSDPHFFFADPDPGKNLHADPDSVPDPDPGGFRGRGLGVKGKNEFLLSFFHVSDDS